MGRRAQAEDYSALLTAEEMVAIARGTAPLEAQAAEDARHRALDQHAEMAKWLLASLLAINGGGAIAAVNMAGRADAAPAATIFAAGLLCALLAGFLIQQAAAKVQAPLVAIRGYWLVVAEDGERIPAIEEQNGIALREAMRFGRLAPICGFISTGFFVAGAWALAHADLVR